jgi:tartrate dehydratase beta subunit/fumarate hydratase class I family protein
VIVGLRNTDSCTHSVRAGATPAVAVREACKKHGGVYLGSIGGAAANLAEHCIKKVEVVEYPELGTRN